LPKKSAPQEFDLVVRRSRCGLGLFTAESIPKDVSVAEYTGRMISEKQVEKSRSRYLFDVGGEGALDGSPRSNRARYINHSCRPNCIAVVRKKRVFIRSLRQIRPGEELTYDYGKDYFDNFINSSCVCLKCKPELGMARSRKRTRGRRR
jgi:SET domain-containing protein